MPIHTMLGGKYLVHSKHYKIIIIFETKIKVLFQSVFIKSHRLFCFFCFQCKLPRMNLKCGKKSFQISSNTVFFSLT